MLTIILTSYNRPFFVRRAIESVLAQKEERWRLIIQDDGSDEETVQVVMDYAAEDARIEAHTRDVTDEERRAVTRYALLINETLPALDEGLVAYMCDNVEYHPALVGTVYRHFEQSSAFAGYVLHERDVWTPDGQRLGEASDYGHWNHTPPRPCTYVFRAMGRLDHSQVFHRLPTGVRWEEDVRHVGHGDGIFFDRLITEHGPIEPIRPGKVLTHEHLFV